MAETQGDKLRKKFNQEASKASKRKNYQNPMKMERRKEGFRSKNPKVKFMDEMDAMTTGLDTLTSKGLGKVKVGSFAKGGSVKKKKCSGKAIRGKGCEIR